MVAASHAERPSDPPVPRTPLVQPDRDLLALRELVLRPDATKVADRWHLVDNLADVLEALFRVKVSCLTAAAAALSEQTQGKGVALFSNRGRRAGFALGGPVTPRWQRQIGRPRSVLAGPCP